MNIDSIKLERKKDNNRNQSNTKKYNISPFKYFEKKNCEYIIKSNKNNNTKKINKLNTESFIVNDLLVNHSLDIKRKTYSQSIKDKQTKILYNKRTNNPFTNKKQIRLYLKNISNILNELMSNNNLTIKKINNNNHTKTININKIFKETPKITKFNKEKKSNNSNFNKNSIEIEFHHLKANTYIQNNFEKIKIINLNPQKKNDNKINKVNFRHQSFFLNNISNLVSPLSKKFKNIISNNNNKYNVKTFKRGKLSKNIFNNNSKNKKLKKSLLNQDNDKINTKQNQSPQNIKGEDILKNIIKKSKNRILNIQNNICGTNISQSIGNSIENFYSTPIFDKNKYIINKNIKTDVSIKEYKNKNKDKLSVELFLNEKFMKNMNKRKESKLNTNNNKTYTLNQVKKNYLNLTNISNQRRTKLYGNKINNVFNNITEKKNAKTICLIDKRNNDK